MAAPLVGAVLALRVQVYGDGVGCVGELPVFVDVSEGWGGGTGEDETGGLVLRHGNVVVVGG